MQNNLNNMAYRGVGQLGGGDLSAFLSGSRAAPANSNPSMASLIMGQGQPAAPSTLASLGLDASSMALNSASAPQAPEYQSQATSLLSALLQQQQREDQKKAAYLQHLNSAFSAPQQPSAPATADNLSLLLQQKQLSLPQASAVSANPLTLLTGAPQIAGASPSTNIYGGPTHGGQLDAVAIAKLLQSQQGPTSAAAAAPQAAPQATLAAGTGAAASLAAQLSNPSTASATTALLDSAAALSMQGDTRRRKGRTGTFPQKLHQMLSDLERQEGGTDIASFLPHGRAFAIHKPRDFVKHVMPKYFRMSRFSSFQRQLNLYDFQRITEGPDKGSYYHELFVQGRPILSTMMKRNKIKGVKNLKQQEEEKVLKPTPEETEEKEPAAEEEQEEEGDEATDTEAAA